LDWSHSMRIILDECLPRRLVRDLHPHSATTVPREGWAGIKNGVLLKLIIPAFDIFITLDSNLVHQQNLEGVDLCVITLHSVNSRYETLQPLVPDMLRAIGDAKSGVVIHLGN
jgi:predicted nuclease of predicted toxin-antitoxin system